MTFYADFHRQNIYSNSCLTKTNFSVMVQLPEFQFSILGSFRKGLCHIFCPQETTCSCCVGNARKHLFEQNSSLFSYVKLKKFLETCSGVAHQLMVSYSPVQLKPLKVVQNKWKLIQSTHSIIQSSIRSEDTLNTDTLCTVKHVPK